MLRTRLISAAVMIVIVVGGLFYLPTPGFALLLALVMAAGLWEWSRMIPVAALPGFESALDTCHGTKPLGKAYLDGRTTLSRGATDA